MRTLNRNHVRIDVLALQALVQDALGEEATALEKLGGALELAEPGGFLRNFVDLGSPMADLLARLQCQHEASQSAIAPYLAQILAAFPAPRPGRRQAQNYLSARIRGLATLAIAGRTLDQARG